VLERLPEQVRAELVLLVLAHRVAEARLLHRQPGQLLAGLAAGAGHGLADAVDLRLIELAQDVPGLARPPDEVSGLLDAPPIAVAKNHRADRMQRPPRGPLRGAPTEDARRISGGRAVGARRMRSVAHADHSPGSDSLA